MDLPVADVSESTSDQSSIRESLVISESSAGHRMVIMKLASRRRQCSSVVAAGLTRGLRRLDTAATPGSSTSTRASTGISTSILSYSSSFLLLSYSFLLLSGGALGR